MASTAAKRKPGRPKRETVPGAKAPRKTAKRKRRQPKQLPMLLPEVMPEVMPSRVLEPTAEKSPFLEGLGEMFSMSPKPENPRNGSADGSTTSLVSDAASAETEQVLAAVPDVIGGPEVSGVAQLGPDGITALLDAVAFEEQDVKDTLEETFLWIGAKFGSDHWTLTERQIRMLGRPATQLLNSVWTKLKARIPDILTAWCESTPGATAFLMAAGIVIGPKVMKQISISRERAKAIPQLQQAQAGTPGRKSPTSNMSGGIPSATGIIGSRA